MKTAALILLTISVCAFAAHETQTKVRTRPLPQTTPTPTSAPEPTKRNVRTREAAGAARSGSLEKKSFDYEWEFTQPEFRNKRIFIKHDINGKGEIVFERAESEEVRDPLTVSPATLERINAKLKKLDFLTSKEDYQYEKDYSHLGKQTFRYRSGNVSREVRLNYTTNPDMAAILDEYRRIGNQAMWVFDVLLARDSHPLDTPGLMDGLDSLLKINEISDADQMVPFLKEISVDERFPLIARNHALRIINRIENKR